jgi:hypothetical protein
MAREFKAPPLSEVHEYHRPIPPRRIQFDRSFSQSYRLGGLSLRLHGQAVGDVEGGVAFERFESRDGEGDIEVDIRWAEGLRPLRSELTFDSGATWRSFRVGRGLAFEFRTPLVGSRPYKQLRVEPSFSRAELVLSRTALAAYDKISPVEYPLCELLITNYLAYRGLGVEVHGCGLLDREAGGHLFLGHSGAGKSTTARLWERLRAPEILSDDRIILRRHGGELWMYGTPWHGEAAFASPARAKVRRIYILEHGTENRFSALTRWGAAAEVFARSFPPFHSPFGLERTVEFLQRALESVPCYQFQFLPNPACVGAVLASNDLG